MAGVTLLICGVPVAKRSGYAAYAINSAAIGNLAIILGSIIATPYIYIYIYIYILLFTFSANSHKKK